RSGRAAGARPAPGLSPRCRAASSPGGSLMPVPLPPFTIEQPATLAEASRMLLAGGDDARPYAGGTELLLVMKHGGLRYDRLVDVKTIPDLDQIEERP